MTIHLRPDDEKLVQERLQSGVFCSAEEVIHDALAAQSAEVGWVAENRGAIDERISSAIAELDRGEGISDADARAWLNQRKASWIRENQR